MPTPYLDPAQNGQRDQITQALMNIASPPPQMPQQGMPPEVECRPQVECRLRAAPRRRRLPCRHSRACRRRACRSAPRSPRR